MTAEASDIEQQEQPNADSARLALLEDFYAKLKAYVVAGEEYSFKALIIRSGKQIRAKSEREILNIVKELEGWK